MGPGSVLLSWPAADVERGENRKTVRLGLVVQFAAKNELSNGVFSFSTAKGGGIFPHTECFSAIKPVKKEKPPQRRSYMRSEYHKNKSVSSLQPSQPPSLPNSAVHSALLLISS